MTEVMHWASVSEGSGMEIRFSETAAPGKGFDFIISDGSQDNHGTTFNPNGWQLRRFLQNPTAKWAHGRDPAWGDRPIGRWENVRVDSGRLVGRLVLAAKGTAAFIDELWRLIEQGLIRAVSIGGRPLKRGNPAKGGYNFEETELLEVSLVSVGSNPNALAIARSLHISDETISRVFGEQAAITREDMTPGEQADKRPAQMTSPSGRDVPIRKDPSKMSTISQRVAEAQRSHDSAVEALNTHLADDGADETQTEALTGEVEVSRSALEKLQRAERALASTAAATGGTVAKPAIRKPLGLKGRDAKPGDLLIRSAVVNAVAFISQRDPIKVLEERYGDHEATNVFVRAAVDPAKTTVSGWAAELIETDTVAFLETLRANSFYPRLAGMGTNLQFGQGRGAIKIPSRSASPSISGSFVSEGSPIPVRRIGLTSATLNPHKMGVISYFTREMARYSTPQIESLLRQEIQADTALTIDTLLIDTTAGSTTRPAGLLNGVSALAASTAGGWSAIIEDIETLASPFDSANAGRSLVLLMNPRESRRLRLAPGPDGKLGWAAEALEGIDIIVSTVVPAGRLIMIDAADFATAAANAPEFDVSEQAVIHAEDTSPAQIGTAGSPNVVAAPTISMFQTASIALRMLLDITWTMRRTGMVQTIASADWAPIAE